jgi:predicted metal-dependent hydrolase
VPYLGTDLALRPEPGRIRVHLRGGVLLVPESDTRAALERWYRRRARAEIAPRLERAAAALGRSYSKLTIRDQRTRWGSCSTTGAMSFNWRLLLAPEAVLEYVVRHEAAHLVVMDHSPRFWALMERSMPGYAQPRRWLRDHGATLVL